MTAKKPERVGREGLRLSLLLLLAAGLLLAGCSTPTPTTPTAEPFKPVPPPTATPEPTVNPIALTPTVDPQKCDAVLSWISDVTLPDGSTVEPGSTIDKQWEIENSGTCNWGEGYTLHRIAGPSLGSPDVFPLYPARAGTRANLRVVLTAPSETGSYHAAWQAHNPNGQPFGDAVFVDFVVP